MSGTVTHGRGLSILATQRFGKFAQNSPKKSTSTPIILAQLQLSQSKWWNHPGQCGRPLIDPGNLKIRGFHTAEIFHRQNYYLTLGVTKNATPKEIKQAYYKLAKAYHPDRNKGKDCQRKFQEVSEAYEVLSDLTKKKDYDTWGQTAEQMRNSRKSTKETDTDTGASERDFARAWKYEANVDPEDLFRRIFGDAAPTGRDPFMDDYRAEIAQSIYGYGAARDIVMNITFEEAARGTTKEAILNVVDDCPKCRGTRCEIGTGPSKCLTCDGTGMETLAEGPFIMRAACRDCDGQGEVIRDPCVECQGIGQMVQRKNVEVPVPAGVEDGQTILLPVVKRDVFITFRVSPSTYFRRNELDIHSDAPISLSQSILGGTSRIKGLYEDLTIDIPAGTGPNTEIKIRGKGIKHPNGYSYGDHYVNLNVQIPPSLSSVQEAVFKAYAEMERDTPGTIKGITLTKTGTQNPEEVLKEIKKTMSSYRDSQTGAWFHSKNENPSTQNAKYSSSDQKTDKPRPDKPTSS